MSDKEIYETWRWRVGQTIKTVGYWLIREGAQVMKLHCKCSLCQGDMERFLNEAEEDSIDAVLLRKELNNNLLCCERPAVHGSFVRADMSD